MDCFFIADKGRLHRCGAEREKSELYGKELTLSQTSPGFYVSTGQVF